MIVRNKKFLIIGLSLSFIFSSCNSGKQYYPVNYYQNSYRELINTYMSDAQAADISAVKEPAFVIESSKELTESNFWWEKEMSQNIFLRSKKVEKNLETLYLDSVKYSPEVRVFSDLPLIRRTSIDEAEGRFDVRAFAESKWDKNREPVGRSGLVNPGVNDYQSEQFSTEAGFRKRFQTGAEASISQRFNHEHDNSSTLDHNPQTQGVMTLSVIQPLMKGAGVKYNTSTIQIAKIDAFVSDLEFERQVMDHISEVNKTYWLLYAVRGEYFILKKLYQDTKEIVDRIRERQDLDQNKTNLLTAEAALLTRESLMIRAETAIKNFESRMRVLVNSPDLKDRSSKEFIPSQNPTLIKVDKSLKDCLATALDKRSEIKQAFEQLNSLDIQKDMAKNELLPQLNLIAEASMNGNADHSDYWDSAEDSKSHNSFLVGLSYEFAIKNTSAKARYLRRNLEMRQQLEQINATIDSVLFDVKVAHRELNTSFREVTAKHKSMQATDEDLKAMKERWELARDTDGKSTYLQFLLDTQIKHARSEEAMINALVDYNISIENLEKVQGTLLSYHNFRSSTRGDGEMNLPRNQIVKAKETPDSMEEK